MVIIIDKYFNFASELKCVENVHGVDCDNTCCIYVSAKKLGKSIVELKNS